MKKRREKRGKKGMVADINVVPYIDVMLVLLVIFMITAPMLMQGVQVELPKAPSKPIEQQEEPLIVSVKADGTFYINLGKDEKVAQPLPQIAEQVGKIVTAKPQTPVYIWGDANVNYGVVVEAMSALQNAGVESVGLVTEPPN